MFIEFGMMIVFPQLAARAFTYLSPTLRDEGAGLFNLVKTLGFSFGTTAVGTLLYQGQLSNWSRYVGDISASNPAMNQYLDDIGSNVSYDTKVAYVVDLFETQMKILTISQIVEKVALATFLMAFLAVFFNKPKPVLKPA